MIFSIDMVCPITYVHYGNAIGRANSIDSVITYLINICGIDSPSINTDIYVATQSGPKRDEYKLRYNTQGMIGYKCMYCTILMISLVYYFRVRH